MKVQVEEYPAACLLPGPVAGLGGPRVERSGPLPSQKGWEMGCQRAETYPQPHPPASPDPIPVR